MKIFFALCMSLFSVNLFAGQEHSLEPWVVNGTVTRTVDGDTVKFKPNQVQEKDWSIRFLGIDTPELHLPVTAGPPASQSPWGQVASDYLAEILPVGSTIQLVTFGKDIHGRVLGRLERNGQDINLEMVKAGWAITYFICDGPTCDSSFIERQKVATYASACKSARENHLGIFDSKNPLKEMPFEFRLRLQKREPDKYVGDLESHELYAPKDYSKVDVCNRIFFKSEKTAAQLGFQIKN